MLEPLLGVARVAAGLELLVEGVVDPRLALAGRLLAVERVEVLVVRVRIVHEPADPHELELVLPQPLAEHALLEDLELGLHVEVLEEHGLHGLGERLGAQGLVAHRERDLGPVLAALERRALEHGPWPAFGSNFWMVADLRVVEGAGKARRDHRVGGDGEALRHLHDVLAVDRVGDARGGP